MVSGRDEIEYLLLLTVYKANSDLGWWRGEIEYLLLLHVYKANSDWPLREAKLSIYTQIWVVGKAKLSILFY